MSSDMTPSETTQKQTVNTRKTTAMVLVLVEFIASIASQSVFHAQTKQHKLGKRL